jgi:hypothetical protein
LPDPEQPGTYNEFELQSGTVLCLKIEVPQTGKAVSGVWPFVVHVCAVAAKQRNRKEKKINTGFKFIISMTGKNILSLH